MLSLGPRLVQRVQNLVFVPVCWTRVLQHTVEAHTLPCFSSCSLHLFVQTPQSAEALFSRVRDGLHCSYFNFESIPGLMGHAVISSETVLLLTSCCSRVAAARPADEHHGLVGVAMSVNSVLDDSLTVFVGLNQSLPAHELSSNGAATAFLDRSKADISNAGYAVTRHLKLYAVERKKSEVPYYSNFNA